MLEIKKFGKSHFLFILLSFTHDFGLKYFFVYFREVALEYLKLSHKMVRGIVKILISKLGVSPDDSKINPGCEDS